MLQLQFFNRNWATALDPRRIPARPCGWLFFILIALLGLTLFAGSAQAQQFINAPNNASVWTVHAFGNAQAVSDAFRAIANFANSSTFRGIVVLLAIIGVLSVGISSGFSMMIARQFISYAVFVLLVVYLLFGFGSSGPLSVKVEVIDTVDNTWVAPVTVPAIVGIPASLISTAGHELTRQVEASFPLPDEMKLSEGAPFNLAATMISDMSKAKIQDPNLANSLAYYVQDCFVIAAAQGSITASTLLNSTNFLQDLGSAALNSVYINTTLGDPVGVAKLKSCNEVYGLITAAINAHGNDAASFMSDASSWHTTPTLSVVNSAADQVASWATNGAINSGGSLVKQAAVLAAFKPAFNQAAASTGNSDFLTTIAVTQATESQKNSWVMGAEIFNRMMGYFFAVLQVFIYALTPLILAAALIPSLGLSLLKHFTQVLLWLTLWQPMLAIVNFVVLAMQQSSLGGALGVGAVPGLTMNSLGLISERTSSLSAAATVLGTMVPVLAWAFVKGSVDFSRMIGSAVGENFAQQAGNTATTGNYSLNQASLDSFTANKTSISAISDFGHGYAGHDTAMQVKNSDHQGVAEIGGMQPTQTVTRGRGFGDAGSAGDSAGHRRGDTVSNAALSNTGLTQDRAYSSDQGRNQSSTGLHNIHAGADGAYRRGGGGGGGRSSVNSDGSLNAVGATSEPTGDVTSGGGNRGTNGADIAGKASKGSNIQGGVSAGAQATLIDQSAFSDQERVSKSIRLTEGDTLQKQNASTDTRDSGFNAQRQTSFSDQTTISTLQPGDAYDQFQARAQAWNNRRANIFGASGGKLSFGNPSSQPLPPSSATKEFEDTQDKVVKALELEQSKLNPNRPTAQGIESVRDKLTKDRNTLSGELGVKGEAWGNTAKKNVVFGLGERAQDVGAVVSSYFGSDLISHTAKNSPEVKAAPTVTPRGALGSPPSSLKAASQSSSQEQENPPEKEAIQTVSEPPPVKTIDLTGNSPQTRPMPDVWSDEQRRLVGSWKSL